MGSSIRSKKIISPRRILAGPEPDASPERQERFGRLKRVLRILAALGVQAAARRFRAKEGK